MKHTILIEQGTDYLIDTVKEIPAVTTQGKTEQEVLEKHSVCT